MWYVQYSHSKNTRKKAGASGKLQRLGIHEDMIETRQRETQFE